jgi:hypothetical protein
MSMDKFHVLVGGLFLIWCFGTFMLLIVRELIMEELADRYCDLAEWSRELQALQLHEDDEELAKFEDAERDFKRLEWIYDIIAPQWLTNVTDRYIDYLNIGGLKW